MVTKTARTRQPTREMQRRCRRKRRAKMVRRLLYAAAVLLVSGDVLVSMLKLTEFQNPLTGLNFQGTGKLVTPMGATLVRSSAVPAGTILGLDKNYALELVRASDVLVEYDKLIDRQLERAAVTTISGFAKVFKDASRVLEVKK